MFVSSLSPFFQNDLSAQNALNPVPQAGKQTGFREAWQDSSAQPKDYERTCTDKNGCDISDAWDNPVNKASETKKKKGA